MSSYSLFENKCNITEIMFGKTDAELAKERNTLPPSMDSDEVDYAKNFFILKVLDSLLEVLDPRAIRLPTHIPPPPLATAIPRRVASPPLMTTCLPLQYPSQHQMVSPPMITAPPRYFPFPPPPMSVAAPLPQQNMMPPQYFQYPPFPFVQVPLVPTPQMMSIPPPPIGYFH